MKKVFGKMVQNIGVLIVLCGIICMEKLLVGFSLLVIGVAACYFGTEVERAR